MRLGNLSGTIETIENPLITVVGKNRIALSPATMEKLNVEDGGRVDFQKKNDGSIWIAKEFNVELGQAIKDNGRITHTTIHSVLTQNEFGKDVQWKVSEETSEEYGLVWYKLVIFNTPVSESTPETENTEVITEVVTSGEDLLPDAEPITEEAPVVATDVEEVPSVEDSL
jgi:antitoxin component of MazEF toxin-antitoxin module